MDLQRYARGQLAQLLPGYAHMLPGDRIPHLRTFLTTDAFVDVSPEGPLDAMMGDARYFLNKSVTGSSQVTQEALQVYYGENFFRFNGKLAMEKFLRPRTDPQRDPDDGFEPSQWIKKLSFTVHGIEEKPVMLSLPALLNYPQLRFIVLHLQGSSPQGLSELREQVVEPAFRQVIEHFEKKLPQGILVMESLQGVPAMVCTQPGWTSQAGETVRELEAEWHGCNQGLREVLEEMREDFFDV